MFADADDFKISFFKFVRNSQCQRRFAADEGQVNRVFDGKIRQSLDFIGFYVYTTGNFRDSRVAVGAKDFFDFFAFRKNSAQSVFAPLPISTALTA